jgi:hypothetical protein
MAPSNDEPQPDDEAAPSRPSPADDRGGLSDWTAALRDVAPYLDLGWRLAAAAAGPPLIGHLLVDYWLGTTPWGVLAGAALGAAAAALQLRRLQEELDR